jgi:hypothetical protein
MAPDQFLMFMGLTGVLGMALIEDRSREPLLE